MTAVSMESKSNRNQTRSAKIRSNLGYPVIDADFHTNEFLPVLNDYVDKIGGANAVDRLRSAIDRGYAMGRHDWYKLTPQERLHLRVPRPAWWLVPAKNTRDYATTSIPSLLHERLQESGTDFAVIYPNISVMAIMVGDPDLRRTLVRAFNMYHADIFRPYSDHLTPVAAVPLHTPEEGIEELEYAVNVLGMKAALIPGGLKRPIPAIAEKYPAREHPDVAQCATWFDAFGIDSAYDYDPFWAKLIELGVTAATHTAGMWFGRNTVNNYMYNHIGHFADASHAFAKSLFMGGVTRRFPKLRIGFLEGGAGWAAQLYCDLVDHWQKRGYPQILKYDPGSIDRDELLKVYRERGPTLFGDRVFDDPALLRAIFENGESTFNHQEDPSWIDDFAAAGIDGVESIRDQFIPNFFFGSEAGDPTVALAFNTKVNPLGAKLNAMRGTDSGHWDVPDLGESLAETWDLVERGTISEAEFKEIVYLNPYRFYTDLNPNFFRGTAVETVLRRRPAQKF